MTHFHFTLGPVQGFVAQARRTRDFWAGSFILSWLSAVAMKAVKKQGGNIAFPKPDAEFMAAVENGGSGPKQGKIPNRFMAEVNDVFEPEAVVTAVRRAWIALAEEVWKNDLAGFSDKHEKTRKIWKRQIEDLPGFWDIEWALEDRAASNTLDRLKNSRTYLPPDEPGLKCMMMDGWQELSGAKRSGNETNDFWKAVRESSQNGIKTDLRPGEKLCAIAFVKRRFARCFHKLEQDMGGWTIKGWRQPNAVPSVHYLAVAPWLAQLLKKTNNETASGKSLGLLLDGFHQQALQLTDSKHNEWETNIRCVREADGKREWKALDGSIFFDAMLENKNIWDETQQERAKTVLELLKGLRRKAVLDPASPFYAILMMDGDSLGEQMSDPAKQQIIAESLAKFTEKASSLVLQNNGFLIYAGGDDVLALLPLEDALNCATALRQHYLDCFRNTPVPTSISAAIEYAHVKIPLGKVLKDAHDLLDKVAKDGRGRDAIACRVWKPGGMLLEWAQPWEIAFQEDGFVLKKLAATFQKNSQDEEEQDRFAAKFFYRIRERFTLLNPDKDEDKKGLKPILSDDQAISLMAMEYLNSGAAKVKTMDEARSIIAPLLEQCRPVIRDKTKAKKDWKRLKPLEAEGALLVHFLAKKGIEQ